MKKTLSVILLVSLLMPTLFGCKKTQTSSSKTKEIDLVMYGLFDDSEIYEPLIQEYESSHTNINITYKQFTDPETYLDIVVNELAEGEGPDIFAIHNSWIYKHEKKVSPYEISIEKAQEFENTFVSVVTDDLLRSNTGEEGEITSYKMLGLPMYVDSIALYYNEDQFEDAIPSQGKPSNTWTEIIEDVYKLTKTDNSFERFEVAGIAMGRSDNILRAMDILYTLFLQYGVDFYNDDYTKSTITSTEVSTSLITKPAEEAIELYTSFAVPSNKNYCWNEYISDPESEEKELQAFIEGKVSMIFGYSYIYEDLLNLIDTESKKGTDTIDKDVIKIAEVPQSYDPETSTDKRNVYASYFAYTVTRTSEYPEEAWEFLDYLTSKEVEEYYFEETHKPSSRRDLLEDQMQDPIYGVFAEEVGYAETIPMADSFKYAEIFSEAIDSILATIKASTAIKTAEEQINAIMPEDGL